MAGLSATIVNLNVGGRKFSSSRETMCKDPTSMLARMFDTDWAGRNRVDEKGRVFIDRDPRHFSLILNFLRDGTCVLPADAGGRRELLQEADFYQLEGLRAYIMAEDSRHLQSAQDLRSCIAQRLEMDEDVKGVVALLVRCAYGRPADRGAPIPGRAACVEVAMREGAFNPLTPPSSAQPRDETIYVAFQQHIRFQGDQLVEQYEGKHESSLVYEGGALSYDPRVYGGTFAERGHIKALQAYEHHCIAQLPAAARQLRDAAVYMVANSLVVQWALEVYGFREVSIKVHAAQQAKRLSETGGAADEATAELFKSPSPVLANIRFTINLSI